MPAGVKFDPSDQEIIEHLEAKVVVRSDLDDGNKLFIHPLIDEFIQTIDGENGICYTHPEKLPGHTSSSSSSSLSIISSSILHIATLI